MSKLFVSTTQIRSSLIQLRAYVITWNMILFVLEPITKCINPNSITIIVAMIDMEALMSQVLQIWHNYWLPPSNGKLACCGELCWFISYGWKLVGKPKKFDYFYFPHLFSFLLVSPRFLILLVLEVLGELFP